MDRRRRLLERLRRGHLRNVHFGDLCRLVEAFGFDLVRMEGSHRAYCHPGIPELVNLQPLKSGDAKPYELRQFLKLVDRYNLSIER